MKLIHLNGDNKSYAVVPVDGQQWTDAVGIEIQTSDGNGIFRLVMNAQEALVLASRLTWQVSEMKGER
jgi:hypothetical protein